MNLAPRRRIGPQSALSDLAASILGIASAAAIYQWLSDQLLEDALTTDRLIALAVAAAMCWCGMLSSDLDWGDYLTGCVGQAFAATGFILLAQYPLSYLFKLVPTPWPVIAGGCVIAVVLGAAFKGTSPGRKGQQLSGILLVGFTPVAAELARSYEERITGVLDADPSRVPAEFRFLGHPSTLREIATETQPGLVIVCDSDWRQSIPPRTLLDLRYSGIEVAEGPALYESELARVCWAARHPVDLLLEAAPNLFRSVNAVQAIYTNLIGLALLVAFSPLLILFAFCIFVFSGGRPVLEQVPSLGYQQMPFRLLRFRTRFRDGRPSGVGKVIRTLGLVNLPRLLNVVRGELALFGPPPVRREFAGPLSALMPAYGHRFMVKPGLLGWSQLNLPRTAKLPDEGLRLEYDLYYTKLASALLDASILMRLLFRAVAVPSFKRRSQRAAEIR